MPGRRDAAFAALKRIPALTCDAIARVPQAKLEAAVALAGPMKDERIRALRAGADLFRREPALLDDVAAGGSRAFRAARRLPHLGRASSLRVLLYSGRVPVLPLDEHAVRVALRLGCATDDADRPPARTLSLVRQALTAAGRDVPTLRLVSQYLTHHGLMTCTEAAPHCAVCPLALDCAWIRRQ
jgi:endonuclease III